jgi:hypothetical protein
MKTKVLCGVLIGTLAMAGQVMGAVYTDAATNYPGNSWTNGSNGGTGFGPWSIVADSQGGWAGQGIWNSAGAGLMMGEAFGYVGKVGYVDIDRAFNQALNIGDVFEFDFGVNWDSNGGNKGFNLYANGVQVISVNHGNFPGYLTLNGSPALTNYGTNTMHWTFTQVAANQIAMQATGRDGVETFAATMTTEVAYGYVDSLRFYSSGLESSAPDQRQSYFNNLKLTQAGAPPPPPDILEFTSGTWNPAATGDYPFTLARSGAVGTNVVLTSSNTNAVTVPPEVNFAAGSNSVTFNVTVVSLTAGNAIIVASNAASGATAEYVVTPVPPSLSIAGPWELYALGSADYTLTRVGAVGSNIVLSSSAPDVLKVTNSLTFAEGETDHAFQATAVALGSAKLVASNASSGAWTEYDVTVKEPSLNLTGPTSASVGETPTYTLKRNGPIGGDVNLASVDPTVMTVPTTVSFAQGENTVTFQAAAVAAGATVLTAGNDDATSNPLGVTVTEVLPIIAYDEAGNYTLATFTNGSNLGYGFGAWELWNTLATLGDSTAGGGGDLNSTNGYSFRFMGDGADGWCNGKRNFANALQVSNVLTFTFTYNWDGGGRGVDIFSQSGQFANLINVINPNTFQVNGTTISTDYSPGAVVAVKITQLADGIQMNLTRSVGGVENLYYTTNILSAEPATGVSMYCGGYSCAPEDNVNYAIFMNDLTIRGIVAPALTFTGGTWNPSAVGGYPFELTRAGAVGDEIVLTSSNTNSVTVPPGVTFGAASNKVSFHATVVSLTNGEATILASNVASGAWAEYTVKPFKPANPPIGDLIYNPTSDGLSFTVPDGYTLGNVYGADNALLAGDWNWQLLALNLEYTISGNQVTILTTTAARMVIRIGLVE